MHVDLTGSDSVVKDAYKHISGAGKGSAPRNCFSEEFKRNWERIFKRRKHGKENKK